VNKIVQFKLLQHTKGEGHAISSCRRITSWNIKEVDSYLYEQQGQSNDMKLTTLLVKYKLSFIAADSCVSSFF
jgi:hypothetical protein